MGHSCELRVWFDRFTTRIASTSSAGRMYFAYAPSIAWSVSFVAIFCVSCVSYTYLVSVRDEVRLGCRAAPSLELVSEGRQYSLQFCLLQIYCCRQYPCSFARLARHLARVPTHVCHFAHGRYIVRKRSTMCCGRNDSTTSVARHGNGPSHALSASTRLAAASKSAFVILVGTYG